ncbi:MAG: hypothetical protein ACP5U0_07995 [Caldisphaera sp.]
MLFDRLKGETEFLGEVKLGAIVSSREKTKPYSISCSCKIVE